MFPGCFDDLNDFSFRRNNATNSSKTIKFSIQISNYRIVLFSSVDDNNLAFS